LGPGSQTIASKTAKMMPRQPYAPTPHSYVPNTAMSATIDLHEVCATLGSFAKRQGGEGKSG
jgi:hypothetical protein